MTAIEVWAEVGGRDLPVGRLFSHRRGRAESATFSYDATYLADPEGYAFDPELPLRLGAQQTRVGQALFGALSDSAPDRWGRTLLDRREAATARAQGRAPRQLDELDYLVGVRDDLRQGALRCREHGGVFLAAEDGGVPALTSLPDLLDLAARAESDTADLPDLQRLVRVGSSLGGARPKAHVLDPAGRIAIAKFPSVNSDTWNVMAWEKVALDLADAAGIRVPPSRLLHLAGRSVLVLQRFDRSSGGGRIGYVSAMTMLEASDRDQRTYLDIAEVVENVSDDVTRELRQLWRRMVFNVLVSNTDDHLRNHAFLHAGGGVWRLAPAFDLNPNPGVGRAFLSTSIDARGDEASVTAAVEVADYPRLTEREALTVLEEVTAAVAQWPDVAGRHGLAAREITQMAPAFGAAHR